MGDWSAEQILLVMGGVTTVIASFAAAAVKIIGALQGVEHKVDALEIKVDGRLSQLLDRTAVASEAAGREAGRGERIFQVPPTVVPRTADDERLIVEIPVPTPPILLLPVPQPGEVVEGDQP